MLLPTHLLYLLTEKKWSPREVEHLLYHEAGLRGLSGISNDVRDLLASDAPESTAGAGLLRLSHGPRDRIPRRRNGWVDAWC